APAVACRRAEHVDEGGDVVLGDVLALAHRLDGERRGADRVELVGQRPVHLLAGRDLDPAPGFHPGLVGPDCAEGGACVALDHALMMRTARCAALRGLSRPTAATGTPGGIWTTLSSASSPPAALNDDVSGTPITGRSVWAAATPGSAALRPAPAMITFS